MANVFSKEQCKSIKKKTSYKMMSKIHIEPEWFINDGSTWSLKAWSHPHMFTHIYKHAIW